MRKILIAAAVLIAVAVGAVLFLVSNLDPLVKGAIEKIGTQVAGVPVKVASVDISLSQGRGTISGLTVGNPSGFTTPNAVSLGRITVAIDTESVTKNPIVIKDVEVAAPEVTYELGQGGSNIAVIQKNVQAFTGGGGGGKAAPAQATGGEARKLEIDLLTISGGKVTLATPVPGGKASAALGEIRLTGIGSKSGGASGAEIAGQVLQAVSAASLKAVGNLGLGNLIQGAVPGVAPGAGAAGGLDQLKGLLGK